MIKHLVAAKAITNTLYKKYVMGSLMHTYIYIYIYI